MTHREKVIKLMEIFDLIADLKIAIEQQRYPRGRGGPMMLEISEQEEEGLIELFIQAYENRWSNEEELDQKIAFYESPSGQDILHPPSGFRDNFEKAFGDLLKRKADKYHEDWLECRRMEALMSYNPSKPTVN